MTIHKNGNLEILVDNVPKSVLQSAKSKKLPECILAAWTAAINKGQQEFKPFKKTLKKMPDNLVYYAITSCGLDVSKKLTVKGNIATTVGERMLNLCLNKNLRKSASVLIKDKRIHPDWRLPVACYLGDLAAVKALIYNEKANPGAFENAAIDNACEGGHLAVVQFLLTDKRVDPSVDDQMAFLDAIESGNPDLVGLLLQDPRIDPSRREQEAFFHACVFGNIEIIRLLLQDNRVDPTIFGNAALESAARCGHLQIVQLLLKDSRIKPFKEQYDKIRKHLCERLGAVAMKADILEIKNYG